MENINSEDGLDRAVTTAKLRSPSQVSDTNTMDSFQDGGQQNMNPEQNDYPPSLDSSHVNSDSNNYPQTSGDGGVSTDNYGRMNENIHPPQMPGFGMYGRGSYGMGEQHGGLPMPGSSEFSNQTSQYHGQYLPPHSRTGFSGGPKPGMNPMRQGIGAPGMGMMPPSYNPAQTRLMSGQSISQQSGPTPTLNQLLQSPNSAQRYPNSFSDYGGSQKVPTDMAGYPMQQAWGPHQRAGGMNAFPQAQGTNISGCQAFRNQGGGNMSEIPQQRRSSGMPPNFPQQPSQYNNQQFSPNSQRYMMGAGQVRPGQMNQPYGQQQMPGQFGPNQMVFNQVMSGSQVVHQQQPTPQQPPQPPGPSPPGHSPQAPLPNPQPPTSVSQQPTQTPQSQPSPQPPPPPHTSQPSPMQNQSPQHNQQNSPQNANRSHGKKSSDDSEGMEQNTFDEINAENTRGSQGTPTPSGGLHPGVSNLRVTPSPAGSTGSRSNTPASITGNRATSPMPPRPPSSQLDGQIPQSQMSNQGFGQHIMPPPVGPNQMYNAGNKPMAGMNAVAASASQMGGHFSQYNSQFPGNTATMVTQAITAPVTSVVESMSNDSQQDLLSTYSISPMVNSTSTGAPMSADEPPEKKKKDCVSHPPTPTNLSQSPSGTSVSSYPEEIENLNSPTSWSVGTPKPSQSADLHKLYTMGDEPDRKMFLDRLLYFLEEKGSPITSMPQISKQPLDLYKLYHSVKEKGGMVEVNKAKKWKEICAVVNIGSSASAAFTLKKNYVKYLFALECKYDKGGIDPAPILAQMEAAMQQKRESKQRRAPSPAGSQGSSQDAFRPPSTPNSNSQGMDPFSPNMQPYMGGPNSEPNMGPMGSGMLPHGSMMNSMNPSNNMMGQNSVGGPNSGMLPPHHMSSGPNSMHGSMMPGNMPPSNNMMGNSYAPNSMMPNNMGPNNSMMPNNMGSSSNNMLGNNMGPSNNNLASNMTQPAPPPQNESDSVSVQDPFADEPCPSGPSYPRQSMNSQMPTYSGMQSQTTMSGAYGFNRQNAQHGMSPYSNMSQQSMNNYSENRIGQNEQYNDAYRRTMGMDNFNSNNRNTENFGPGNNQFGPRNSQGSGAQFPFGQQFDRERFDQPNPVNSNQQFRPPSQPGMVTPQQHPEQMYPSRYGSNQQMNPVRSHTPQHDQYPPQSGYPNQSNTFGSPRGVVPQEQYQNYPNQQSGFGGHRPPTSRDVPAGNMYGTPNKRFPPDVERRENFNMSGYNNQPSSFPEKPGGASMMYPQHREGMISPQDNPMHDSRRDPSQWSAMQQRFGSQHSGTNYPASNMNAMPPGSGMLPPMVPPSPSSTGRTMNPRLSPQREKPYMSPPRVQKPGGMVPNAQLPPKKEISFPPDSVEAVQPLLAKRKRLAKQDIGQTEPWKLMMALKSGMLAESTWALDTLSILLFDDSTVTYFTLSHLPGLLEVLLEHFRRCLIDMFGLFNELEVGYDAVLVKQKEKEGSLKSFKVMDVEDYKNLESDTVWKGMRIGENYTYITRQGKVVKVNENDRETALLDGKQWDIYSGFTSKAEHWQLGGGDMSTHVQTHFESLNNHKIFKKLFYYRGMKKDCQDEIVNNVMPLKLSYRSPESAEHASDRENSSFKTTSPPPADHKSVNGVVDSENLHNCINKIHIKKEPVEDEEKENAARTRVGTQPTDNMDVATPAAAAVSDHVKEEPQQEQQQNCSNINNNNQKAEENHQSNSSESHNAKNAVNNDDHCEKDGIVKMDFETQNNKENEKPAENNIVKSEDQMGNPVKRESRLIAPIENGLSVESMFIKAQMCDDQEEEAFERDSPAVCLMSEAQDEIGRRCVCISNIFRSLSCIQGNDSEMSRHPGLMYILGKLLLLHHQHPPRVKVRRKLDKEEPEFEDISYTEHEWWWDHLHALRENTLVIFANICGQLDLSIYPEEICLPILNGLLHWAVCPSACAQDPLPSMSPSSVLSPQRLVLEALCKLCIHEANVDLLLATPPFNRIVQLVNNLTKMLANKKEQVTQEFAVVLLSELVQGDSSAARAIAMQHPSVSLLIDFLETAENNAVQVVSTHGINVLRDSPEMMGTSLDMLRRTANILVHLARVPENRPYFVHQQSRLLNLVMSQILDQHVAQTLADVLYECSHS